MSSVDQNTLASSSSSSHAAGAMSLPDLSGAQYMMAEMSEVQLPEGQGDQENDVDTPSRSPRSDAVEILALEGEQATDIVLNLIEEEAGPLDVHEPWNKLEEERSDLAALMNFKQEHKEEEELFRAGKIESRPLDTLLSLIGHHREGTEDHHILVDVLRKMDGILTQRCRSLEIVKHRDVKEEQKVWVCEPHLYLPPKEEWIDLQQYPECSDLLEAARNGNPKEINDAVKKIGRFDIGLIRDARGRCAMHYAAQNGNVAALEYFGPLANALDSEGWAPLHYAAYFGNRITCDRLLQLGADLNMIDSQGKAAYEYAKRNQMKCTMVSMALSGAIDPDAVALKERYEATIQAKTCYKPRWTNPVQHKSSKGGKMGGG